MHKSNLSLAEEIQRPNELSKMLASQDDTKAKEQDDDEQTGDCIGVETNNQDTSKESTFKECNNHKLIRTPDINREIDQENRKRKSEYILKIVKGRQQHQQHQRPPDTLLDLIVRAITSAPEGYVTFPEIYDFIAGKFPFYQEKSHWWKKCIQVTLRRNRQSFIHIPSSKQRNSLLDGYWTLHPLAAAKFVKDKCSSRKDSYEDKTEISNDVENEYDLSTNRRLSDEIEAKENSNESQVTFDDNSNVTECISSTNVPNNSCPYNLVVKLEKSRLLDRLALSFKKKHAEEFQESTEVSGETNPEKWRGWDKPHLKLEEKRQKLSQIIEETKITLDSWISCDEESMECEESISDEPGPRDNTNETSSLISSLLKAVEHLDRHKRALEQQTMEIQVPEGQGFVGFDHDQWSGPWRGWERVYSRRRDQLAAMVSQLGGTLDLSSVLAQCHQLAQSISQGMRTNSTGDRDKEENGDETTLATKLKQISQDLMQCVPNESTEPPFSYPVLITLALVSSSTQSLPFTEVVRFIQDHFPFYQSSPDNWKTTVQLILNFNNAFVMACQGSCSRKSPEHGGCWRVQMDSAVNILTHALEMQKNKVELNLKLILSEESSNKVTPKDLPTINTDKNENNIIQGEEVQGNCTAELINVLSNEDNEKCVRRDSVIVSTFELDISAKQDKHENSPIKNPFQSKSEQIIEKNNKNATENNILTLDHSLNINKSKNQKEKDSSNTCTLKCVDTVKLLPDSAISLATLDDRLDSAGERGDKSINSTEGQSVKSTQNVIEFVSCHPNEEFVVLISDDEEDHIKRGSSNTNYGHVAIPNSESRDTVVTCSSDKRDRSPLVITLDDDPLGEETSGTPKDIVGASICSICGAHFSCMFYYDHHKCSMTDSFPCYICHVAFKSEQRFEKHLRSQHLTENNEHVVSSACRSVDYNGKWSVDDFKCTACLEVFSSKLWLDMHKERAHPNIFKFECNLCRPAKLFCNKSDLCSHVLNKHHHPVDYVCTECNATFDKQVQLNLHVLLYHPLNKSLLERSKTVSLEKLVFICNKCSKCFDSRHNYNSHIVKC